MERETPVPAKRSVVLGVGKEGGDVLVRVCEGVREVKVSRPEARGKANGEGESGSEWEDGSDEEEEEEDNEVRERVWRVGKVLAEVAVRKVKKGGKVEVTVNVGGELAVMVTAREVGGKGGVRGSLEKPGIVENGKV